MRFSRSLSRIRVLHNCLHCRLGLDNKDFNDTNNIINLVDTCVWWLCFQIANPPKTKDKNNKGEHDMINGFKLSIHIGALNNRLNQNMIVWSYSVFLSCGPNEPLYLVLILTYHLMLDKCYVWMTNNPTVRIVYLFFLKIDGCWFKQM
jgi:hypothetical protein